MGAFDDSLGSLFIGFTISVALWGVSCSQAWNYSRNYSADSYIIKTLVCVCWGADTIQQIFSSHFIYSMIVTDFANPANLQFIPISLPLSVPFFEIAALSAQLFFARRIWQLSGHSWIWTGLTIALLLAKLGVSIVYTIRAISIHAFVESNIEMLPVVNAYASVDVVTDVFIAAVMCWFLYASRTQYQRTNSILNKLILFTTTTGTFTGLISIGMLGVHIASPNSPTFFSLYFILCRLYVNALLASLNIRFSLRESFSNDGAEMTPVGWPQSPYRSGARPLSGSVVVNIRKTEERSTDLIQAPKQVYRHRSRFENKGDTVYEV